MELKKRNSMLNLTAEEASELAEVCIRMKEYTESKRRIDEKIGEKITKQLTEEIADVENCVYVLCEEKILDRRRVEEFTTEKYKRPYGHNICFILNDLSMSCNRLTKAALKVNRVEDIYNPTPLSYASTIWTLYEEITDVMVLINHIYNENFISEKDVDDIKILKMERWKERLETINRGDKSIMIYRNKSVEVKAARFMMQDYLPDWFMDKVTDCTIITHPDGSCHVKTLEGVMKADFGDYIIQDVNGEVYPCKPDIFEKIYEPVLENNLKDC